MRNQILNEERVIFMSTQAFFIKKVLFESEDDLMVELISLNKEIFDNKEQDGKTIVSFKVIDSHIREIPKSIGQGNGTFNNIDIKKYISIEEAEELSQFSSNKEAFLERANNIIK